MDRKIRQSYQNSKVERGWGIRRNRDLMDDKHLKIRNILRNACHTGTEKHWFGVRGGG